MMNNWLNSSAGVALAVLLSSATVMAGDYDISGQICLDKRLLLEQEDFPLYPIYHQAFFKFQAFPADALEVKISSKLRFYDFAMFEDIDGLGDTSQVFPMDLLLWEATVDIYDVIEDHLDLRIGKQRIAWGAADRFNPTDNLNPDDLSDFLAFGEKVPTWAMLADLVLIGERLKLTAVWLPGLVPAVLPRYGGFPLSSGLEGVFEGQMPAGMSTTIGAVGVGVPVSNLMHSMQALRAGGNLLGVDWSLSYFHGYDDIPLEHSAQITLVSLQEMQVDATMVFPELHVVGADLAGELLTVGWWVEAAIFYPQEMALTVTAPSPQGSQTREAVILHSKPYTKLTAGADYTLPWGTFLHFQYVHGLFAERGSELHDYFMLAYEHKFFDGDLKLTGAGMLETDAFDDFEDNHGLSISSEMVLKPYDNIDIHLGHVLMGGRGRALFAQMRDWDQTYIKVKVSF